MRASLRANKLASELASEYAQLIRPQMVLLPLVIYVTILVIDGYLNILNFILGWVLLVCTYGIVTIHNNLSDLEIDRTNQRTDNPLATDVLSRKQVIKALVIISVIGSVAALLIHPLALVWLCAYIFFGWLYSGSLGFKNKGYPAVIVLGICYGVMPWLLGYIVSGRAGDMQLIVSISASFFYVAGIIVLKDFKDLKGDKLHGKMTILAVKGELFAQYFMLLLTSTGYGIYLAYTATNSYLVLCGMGAVFCLLNIFILADKRILLRRSYRARCGTILRALFFCYALSVWSLAVWS